MLNLENQCKPLRRNNGVKVVTIQICRVLNLLLDMATIKSHICRLPPIVMV